MKLSLPPRRPSKGAFGTALKLASFVAIGLAVSCGAEDSLNDAANDYLGAGGGLGFGPGGAAGATQWSSGGFTPGSGGFTAPSSGGAIVGPGTCGNGVVESGEVCDGADFGGQTCASATMNAQPGGSLACSAGCGLDLGGCIATGDPDAGTGGAGFGGAGTGGLGTSSGGALIGAGGTSAGGALIGAGGTSAGGASTGGGSTTDNFIRGPAPTTASASARGPYVVQTYTSGFRDGPGYADATIHYPTNATPPFAAVAVVPGFVSPQSSIQPWGPFLASHGIVTMTIGTNTPGDLPDVRARALLDALETIRTENTRAAGPLNGDVDTSRFAVMGWSMGGGGTLIAANTTPTLKAAISLCGWQPGGQFTTNQVPSLMFAATSDPLAGTQSQGFYVSIPNTTPKMLFEVAGGDHGIANNPANVSGAIGRYGLSWMKVFLERDDRYRQFLTAGKPAGTADYRTNVQ